MIKRTKRVSVELPISIRNRFKERILWEKTFTGKHKSMSAFVEEKIREYINEQRRRSGKQ